MPWRRVVRRRAAPAEIDCVMASITRRSAALAGAGALAGPLFVALATQVSVVAAAAALVAVFGAIVVLSQPWIGFLLTAAVVPLERVGRISSDASTVGFSLMRVV